MREFEQPPGVAGSVGFLGILRSEGPMRVARFASRHRPRVAPGVVVLPVLLVAAVALSAGSPAFAKKDTTPPTFAGLASATTCIPGPIGGGTTTSYRLSWEPATDNRTPVSQIVYDVYQATLAAASEQISEQRVNELLAEGEPSVHS